MGDRGRERLVVGLGILLTLQEPMDERANQALRRSPFPVSRSPFNGPFVHGDGRRGRPLARNNQGRRHRDWSFVVAPRGLLNIPTRS